MSSQLDLGRVRSCEVEKPAGVGGDGRLGVSHGGNRISVIGRTG